MTQQGERGGQKVNSMKFQLLRFKSNMRVGPSVCSSDRWIYRAYWATCLTLTAFILESCGSPTDEWLGVWQSYDSKIELTEGNFNYTYFQKGSPAIELAGEWEIVTVEYFKLTPTGEKIENATETCILLRHPSFKTWVSWNKANKSYDGNEVEYLDTGLEYVMNPGQACYDERLSGRKSDYIYIDEYEMSKTEYVEADGVLILTDQNNNWKKSDGALDGFRWSVNQKNKYDLDICLHNHFKKKSD